MLGMLNFIHITSIILIVLSILLTLVFIDIKGMKKILSSILVVCVLASSVYILLKTEDCTKEYKKSTPTTYWAKACYKSHTDEATTFLVDYKGQTFEYTMNGPQRYDYDSHYVMILETSGTPDDYTDDKPLCVYISYKDHMLIMNMYTNQYVYDMYTIDNEKTIENWGY